MASSLAPLLSSHFCLKIADKRGDSGRNMTPLLIDSVNARILCRKVGQQSYQRALFQIGSTSHAERNNKPRPSSA